MVVEPSAVIELLRSEITLLGDSDLTMDFRERGHLLTLEFCGRGNLPRLLREFREVTGLVLKSQYDLGAISPAPFVEELEADLDDYPDPESLLATFPGLRKITLHSVTTDLDLLGSGIREIVLHVSSPSLPSFLVDGLLVVHHGSALSRSELIHFLESHRPVELHTIHAPDLDPSEIREVLDEHCKIILRLHDVFESSIDLSKISELMGNREAMLKYILQCIAAPINTITAGSRSVLITYLPESNWFIINSHSIREHLRYCYYDRGLEFAHSLLSEMRFDEDSQPVHLCGEDCNYSRNRLDFFLEILNLAGVEVSITIQQGNSNDDLGYLFNHLHRIVVLVTSYSGLRPIPPPVATAHLRILAVSGSNIREFPDYLRSAVNLEGLDISMNPINSLPEWISDLRSLRMLNIIGTAITNLHHGILQLPLRQLHLEKSLLSDPITKKLLEEHVEILT